jgi:hypothetical protein
MKKQLPTQVISHELAQSSVFFQKEHARPARTGANHPAETQPAARDRTGTPNERTEQPNGEAERSSVLTELEEGVRESKRPTERYSFEIYTDMKEKIEDIQYQYKKKTGKKVSASRIIREALAVYFQQIEEAI